LQKSQDETKLTVFSGAEIRLDELVNLIVRADGRETSPDENAVLEHIRVEVLEAYLAEDGYKRLRQSDLLKLFFRFADAKAAAARLKMSERTAQDQVAKFVKYVSRYYRERSLDSRQAQCEERCGRKRPSGVSSSARNNNRSLEHTKELPTMDIGGGCDSCPLRMSRAG
jgi:hypothetical protein